MTQHPVPKGWQGGLDLSYHILQSNENTKLVWIFTWYSERYWFVISQAYLEVNNLKEQADITDVIGVIYGSVEPGEYIMH